MVMMMIISYSAKQPVNSVTSQYRYQHRFLRKKRKPVAFQIEFVIGSANNR